MSLQVDKFYFFGKSLRIAASMSRKVCAGPEGYCAGFSPAIHILQKIFESDVLSLKI